MAQVTRLASEMTRSMGGSCSFAAFPPAEREPLMHWMAEHRREKKQCI